MIRVFIKSDIRLNQEIVLEANQFHYIKNVMRKEINNKILIFNGQDGEWLARISFFLKKSMSIIVEKQTKAQDKTPSTHLFFALIKKDKTDLIVEKATELNIGKITPIITERTIASKTNLERLLSIAIEASEQCERTNLPEINEPLKFSSLLKYIIEHKEISFFIMDETGNGLLPKDAFPIHKGKQAAFIIGPEGGFSEKEHSEMTKIENITKVSLGKNILRAETAVIVAISSWHSVCGDFI